MATPNFAHLLNKPATEIEKPKPMPVGTYYGIVQGFAPMESPKQQTPFLRFNVKLLRAGDDVDQSELAAAKVKFGEKIVSKDFYLTDDAEYRLVEFLESCGIPKEGKSLGEMLAESTNAEVQMEITHRMYNEGRDIATDIKSICGTANL